MTIKDKLAIHNGTPVRTKPFPVWPRPTETMRESLLNTLMNEKWGIGSDIISRFESSFAELHDSKHCISINSGTAALWVALKAAGVKAGDEVIVPAYTFVATASAVLMANAVPVFVDIEIDTFNMDPEKIEDVITEKTKVILPVHIAGYPADLTRINQIAAKYNIAVIEDAAQAHGAEWSGRKVGAIGLGGIFSFQSSKNMPAGEGGAIISNDDDFINTCFSYHNVGRIKGGEWYQHENLGGNFRLSAFPAALLYEQIKTLDNEMKIRDVNADLLDREIEQISGLIPQKRYTESTRVSHHLYIIRYEKDKYGDTPREEFIRALNGEGISAYTGYVPLYRERLFITNNSEYPWLEGIDYCSMNLPVTEKICNEQAIWLKQNYLLGSAEDTMDIVKAFRKVAQYFAD